MGVKPVACEPPLARPSSLFRQTRPWPSRQGRGQAPRPSEAPRGLSGEGQPGSGRRAGWRGAASRVWEAGVHDCFSACRRPPSSGTCTPPAPAPGVTDARKPPEEWDRSPVKRS